MSERALGSEGSTRCASMSRPGSRRRGQKRNRPAPHRVEVVSVVEVQLVRRGQHSTSACLRRRCTSRAWCVTRQAGCGGVWAGQAFPALRGGGATVGYMYPWGAGGRGHRVPLMRLREESESPGAVWPRPEFLEIFLENKGDLAFLLSRNFCGKKGLPTEKLERKESFSRLGPWSWSASAMRARRGRPWDRCLSLFLGL